MTASSFSDVRISPELQALLRRWLSFHRVLWALTAVSFLIAWNRGLALLYGLFSLLLALLCLSYLLPRWQLRRIRARREAAGDFTVGQTGRITYRLDSPGARYHIEVLEHLEFADSSRQHHFFGKLPAQSVCTLEFNCAQRGCYRLGDIRLSCAYPFGIVRVVKRIRAETEEVLVLPRVVALSRIPMPVVADATTQGDVPIPQMGGRDEFTGVREYRHGDELNRIHWPVSARHQELMVKTYDQLDRPSMLVVLDCHQRFNVGDGSRTTFETAITIAASMVRWASRAGFPCFLVTRRHRLQCHTIEALRNDLSALYESMARLACDGQYPYHPIVAEACRRFPQASLVVTFRLDTDTTLPRLPRHVTNIVVEMDSDSFAFDGYEPPSLASRREGNRLIYRVDANSELVDLFK